MMWRSERALPFDGFRFGMSKNTVNDIKGGCQVRVTVIGYRSQGLVLIGDGLKYDSIMFTTNTPSLDGEVEESLSSKVSCP